MRGERNESGAERAILIGLATGRLTRDTAERQLDELDGLARAAGAVVVWRLLQEREQPDPATFIGSGKLETLHALCEELRADLVISDNELTPAQLRNLDRVLGRKVIDRTQLILDIFAKRARTREGKLQVELAQLQYLMPRLVGAGSALSRLGGGIGTRGPGETKLESDRRRLRDRVRVLRTSIAEVRRRRSQLRDRRRRTQHPSVALVGYTNAGKTTLFNRLTRADGVVSDALFVTLDPLTRQVRLSEHTAMLLSDTVGFIDRLPHTLVAAFRATLEEVTEADLLLHVIDTASPDAWRHVGAVERVLEEVGARDVPRFVVLNKSDLADPHELERWMARFPDAVVVSAREGTGIDALRTRVAAALALDARRVTFDMANDDEGRAVVARLYRHARVIRHDQSEDRLSVEADVPRKFLAALAPPAQGGSGG